MLRLCDDIALGIEDGGRTVVPFLDVWGKGGAHQHHTHFFRRGDNMAGDDFSGDGVECIGHVLHRIWRQPAASTVTFADGGTTVVESVCSTMAGPLNSWPGASLSRS